MRPANRTRFYILVWSLLLFASCGNSLVGPPPSGFGTFRGRLNGEPWNGYGWAVLVNDTLYLFGRRDINTEIGAAEEIRMNVPFTGVGSYQVTNAIHGEVQTGNTTFSARASGPMQLSTYDGVFILATVSVSVTGPGGWSMENGQLDMPVFHSWDDVPVFPGPALPPEPPM